jgi:hypothetical protein
VDLMVVRDNFRAAGSPESAVPGDTLHRAHQVEYRAPSRVWRSRLSPRRGKRRAKPEPEPGAPIAAEGTDSTLASGR